MNPALHSFRQDQVAGAGAALGVDLTSQRDLGEDAAYGQGLCVVTGDLRGQGGVHLLALHRLIRWVMSGGAGSRPARARRGRVQAVSWGMAGLWFRGAGVPWGWRDLVSLT